MPTTGRAHPACSILCINPGNAVSDDEVPSTISNSSRIYLMILQTLKPLNRAISPNTAKTNTAHIR